MMKKVTKKTGSLLLGVTVLMTALTANATTVKAETTDGTTVVYLSESWESAAAGEEVKIPFTLGDNQGIQAAVFTKATTNTQVAIYDSTGTNLVSMGNNPMTVEADKYVDMSDIVQTVECYGFPTECNDSLGKGDFYYGITFEADTEFWVEIKQIDAAKAATTVTPVKKPSLNQTSATITVGFTKKLSVSNGTAKSWSSNNKKVASVDKKGKVTAKKTGKATITVLCKDGTKLKCKVTVKKNQYSATKITTSMLTSGWDISAYKASYDSKGNLVVKARAVNCSSQSIDKFKAFKLTVKNANGKTIGTYKFKTKNVRIASGSTKDFTYTIKKSALKKKAKQDLRNATITIQADAYHSYSYWSYQ
jgi:SLAP domain-containing protein